MPKFEHMTDEDRAVLEFIFTRTLKDPKSIGAIARQWGLNGDAADYLQMLQVESTRDDWGLLGKPGLVRASFGLDAREFMQLLKEDTRL